MGCFFMIKTCKITNKITPNRGDVKLSSISGKGEKIVPFYDGTATLEAKVLQKNYGIWKEVFYEIFVDSYVGI